MRAANCQLEHGALDVLTFKSAEGEHFWGLGPVSYLDVSARLKIYEYCTVPV